MLRKKSVGPYSFLFLLQLQRVYDFCTTPILCHTISRMTEPVYIPQFFVLDQSPDRETFDQLKRDHHPTWTDTFTAQLDELFAISRPGSAADEQARKRFAEEKIQGRDPADCGVWVYYPWRNHLVHLPEEADFVAIRTSRNLYKITPAEREALSRKVVAVAGLSVGNGIALTLAQERLAGELRLADFDELELSNLNRIRGSLCDLGLPKTVITARQIAETDPFIRIRLWPEGIREDNLDAFLGEGGPADLLVEVCDSLDIKVMLRERCRQAGIPVVMDTSDRCMIDVERYDLEPDRPLLHGLAGDLNTDRLRGLTNPQKIPYMLRMIGLETLSARAKVSMLEIGQTIPTWPQLASTVVMGAGITADVSRRILLGHAVVSGRYYADPEAIVPGKAPLGTPYEPPDIRPLTSALIQTLTDPWSRAENGGVWPSDETILDIIRLAGMAPSSGNDQPWHFHERAGQLFLFHERSRSYSFGDYKELASQISLGSALENLRLAAAQRGWGTDMEVFPSGDERLVARIRFRAAVGPQPYDELAERIPERHTNRRVEEPQSVPGEHLALLKAAAESVPGARLQWTTDRQELMALGGIISKVDRMRIFHPQGHYDFFHREIIWSDEQARAQKTGMWVGTLEIPPVFVKALEAVKEPEVIDTLRAIDGGRSFEAVTRQSTAAAGAMGFLTMPRFGKEDFIYGGMAGQRLWLMATQLGLAFHPLIAPLYLFPRMLHGGGEGLDPGTVEELRHLRKEFSAIFDTREGEAEIYLFRIFQSRGEVIRPYRLPVASIFTKAS